MPVMEENQVEKSRDVWDTCDEWRNAKGQLHRADGPALEWNDGSKVWFCEGKMHRTDGPAYVGGDGTREWHVHGKELSPEEFREWRAQFLEDQQRRREERHREILEASVEATVLQKPIRITAPFRLQLNPKFA